MFWYRERIAHAEIAFTDREGGVSSEGWSSLNLGSSTGDDVANVRQNHRIVADAFGVVGLSSMSQVHGAQVVMTDSVHPDGSGSVPQCDALVTAQRGLALLVRVADCVPIVLADPGASLVAAVHAGRAGLVEGVVPAVVEHLSSAGATELTAWVGPRACGSCYELPAALADAVEAKVPGSRSTTSWGTAAVDLGAGVICQLQDEGVRVKDIGAQACTIEDERFFSYRRQGAAAGRFGGVVVLR